MSVQAACRWLATLFLCASLPAFGQVFGDQIVVSPPTPSSSQQFQIIVPAHACFMSTPTPLVATSSVQITGNSIVILVTQPSWICFSAGDSLVLKALPFTVGPLPTGTYQVSYTLTMPGSPTLVRSATFAVLGPTAVPTLSPAGMVLLVGLLLAFTLAMRRRHARNLAHDEDRGARDRGRSDVNRHPPND